MRRWGSPTESPNASALDASELLLEEAPLAHVRGGVEPLVDRAAEREDDELVVQASTQGLHTGETRHAHRTTSPPRTTAEW